MALFSILEMIKYYTERERPLGIIIKTRNNGKEPIGIKYKFKYQKCNEPIIESEEKKEAAFKWNMGA